jgi:patatin-like phospholipase/acyl hydrolase
MKLLTFWFGLSPGPMPLRVVDPYHFSTVSLTKCLRAIDGTVFLNIPNLYKYLLRIKLQFALLPMNAT